MATTISKEPVRAIDGQRIVGWIETKSDGDVIVRAFSGKVLGRYDAHCNVTRDFVGRQIAKGNQALLLLNLDNWKN